MVGLKINVPYTVKLPGVQVLHAVTACPQALLFQIIWAVVFILAASLRGVLNSLTSIAFVQEAALQNPGAS